MTLTMVLLFAVSAPAQTAAEQLQKGIYEQESAGDLDAAIQIYRQILGSNPSDRKLAAQAQFRLFQALLQKGDFDGAQQELLNLSINFQEYRELIISMAGRTRGGTVIGASGIAPDSPPHRRWRVPGSASPDCGRKHC
jgi:hypothetical protein